MQKSKKLTIILIIALTAFFILSQNVLIKLGAWYTYLLSPILFIGIAAIINILIATQVKVAKSRREVIQYVIITNLIYIIIYLLSGLVPGYGKNPYDNSIRGIFVNAITSIPVIVSLELMRFKLVNNVFKRDKKLIFILVVIAFTIWDLNLRSYLGRDIVPYTIFSFIFYNLIPAVVRNILFTYIASKGDYVPNLVYRIVYSIFIWSSPVLPKLPGIFEAIISTIIPLFLLLYIRYFMNKKDMKVAQTSLYDENPRGLISFTIVLVLAIWFTLGAFPVKPFGISTGSMYPTIKVGDMVILNKTKPDKIKEGDIIGYRLNGQTIVHRVQTISKQGTEYIFITKGDNNEHSDFYPVKEEQVLGKVVFKVKYVALPTIWLHSVYSGREDVGVETGK